MKTCDSDFFLNSLTLNLFEKVLKSDVFGSAKRTLSNDINETTF